MIARRAVVALFALLISLPAFAASKVDDLAKEGHWDKNAWDKHKDYLGKPAADLELTEWIGGQVTADAMKDKIVVVDFWATWCGPCKAAVPHNNEISKKYAEKGVLVIGACGGGGEENMAKVVEQTKMAYPTAKVSKKSTQAWGVMWWPHYVVVDRKGAIRAIGIQPSFVDKVVDAILEEQPAEKK